jgi:hypothetical protein
VANRFANKDAANASRRNFRQCSNVSDSNKEDLSLALRLEKESNVTRFGYSRRIPKITGHCASNVSVIAVLLSRLAFGICIIRIAIMLSGALTMVGWVYFTVQVHIIHRALVQQEKNRLQMR